MVTVLGAVVEDAEDDDPEVAPDADEATEVGADDEAPRG